MLRFLAELAVLSVACGALSAAPGDERQGIWISPEEVRALPMEGVAWEALEKAAHRPLATPNLGGRDDDVDVLVLAKALVHVRTGEEALALEVRKAIGAAMGTERQGDVLALARNLSGYVIAAELVGLPPEEERAFRAWLAKLPTLSLGGGSLVSVHERRPNNWGTHAGAARVVVARYLGDKDELARVARVFRGWLGERDAYDGFQFGDLSWQADPEHPVGINPKGAQRDGHSLDGVLPDDQRRSGGFRWPPPRENYVYEALQGALLQAMVLARAGYDSWEWGDRALLRAALWLEREAGFPAEGDDTWQPHVIHHVYGLELSLPEPARPGKSVGWTDWTLTPPRIR